MLDQPFFTEGDVLWESQLEYYICHNDWEEVYKLLDTIPSSSLSDGILQISLDGSASSISSREFPDYRNYMSPVEDLDAVCMEVPDVRIFMFSANNMCSLWLRTLVEQQLAAKFVFMKEFWEGTAEIVPLLARSGFIPGMRKISSLTESAESSSDMNFSNTCGASQLGTIRALNKLIMHHGVQYNLPNLLDLYLDHHKLALNKDSLSGLLESAVSSPFLYGALRFFKFAITMVAIFLMHAFILFCQLLYFYLNFIFCPVLLGDHVYILDVKSTMVLI